MCTKETCIEKGPQRSVPCPLEALKNNEIVPQPLRNFSHRAKPNASTAHPKRQSPSRFCVQAIAELQPQKSRNVAFGTPKNNEIVPQPLRNFSHQAKPKKAASGTHPKRQSPSRFCVQAIAELQPQKSRNVAFGTPKNNEIVPQPLRNCSHQAKPKKAASGAHPKRQSPSRFCVQAIAELQPQKSRNVAFGTPKNNEIVPQPLRNFSHRAKPQKDASGAHPKRQSPSRFCVQAIAGVQPQKSRNVAFGTPKNNENVLLLEPLKTMKSCPSHCETAATRQSPRKLRRERIRKTLRLEPLKTLKSCPSHCETSATRQSLRKLRRRNTLLGALPLSEGSAEKEKAKQRSQWGNGVGAMQLGYAETMRNRDHEQCRNVAYETH